MSSAVLPSQAQAQCSFNSNINLPANIFAFIHKAWHAQSFSMRAVNYYKELIKAPSVTSRLKAHLRRQHTCCVYPSLSFFSAKHLTFFCAIPSLLLLCKAVRQTSSLICLWQTLAFTLQHNSIMKAVEAQAKQPLCSQLAPSQKQEKLAAHPMRLVRAT